MSLVLERPAWNARTSAKASSFISGGVLLLLLLLLCSSCHLPFFFTKQETRRSGPLNYPGFSVCGTKWALIWSSGSWNAGVSQQSSTLGWFSWRHWRHQVLQHKSTRHEVTLEHGWHWARNVAACWGLKKQAWMCRRCFWVCKLSVHIGV